MCGSTNKSPIKLNAAEIKLTRWFVYEWGKPIRQKPPPSGFKVTTPKNSLLSQVVTSKEISVPYTNLQLNFYPNTQLDLFCSDNLSFYCTVPSTWVCGLLTKLRKMLATKFFSSSHDEDQYALWSQNPMVHKHSNFYTRIIN